MKRLPPLLPFCDFFLSSLAAGGGHLGNSHLVVSKEEEG